MFVDDKNSVYIGTSGWYYKHWQGNFYIKDCDEKDYLKLNLQEKWQE